MKIKYEETKDRFKKVKVDGHAPEEENTSEVNEEEKQMTEGGESSGGISVSGDQLKECGVPQGVELMNQSGAKGESTQAGPSTFPRKKQVYRGLCGKCSPRKERECEIATKCTLRKSSQKGTDCRYNFLEVCLKKTNLPSKTKKISSLVVQPTHDYDAVTEQADLQTSDAPDDFASNDEHEQPFLDEFDTESSLEQLTNDAAFTNTGEIGSSSGVICSVDAIDAYMYQLQLYTAITTCDDSFRVFVVQDFSTESLSLKPHQYCFVSRSARQFTDSTEWIYACSCDPNASKLTKTLSTHINCQYSQYFPECIHIMVVNRVSSTIDAVHGLSPSHAFADHSYSSDHFENPSLITQTITVIGSENSLCINSDGCYGVLYIARNQKITCATCRFGKTDCIHIQYLSDFCTKTKSELPDVLHEYTKLLSKTSETSLKQYPDHSCLSREKSPFELPSEMSTIHQMPIRERFNMFCNIAELVPCNTSAICSHCQQISWDDCYLYCDATIVTSNQLLPAKVFARRCVTLDCPGVLTYDGREHCLLNMNKFLFAYEVLRGFMFHFLLGRTTMFTEYCILIKAHEDAGNSTFSSTVQYKHFRSAWYAFLALLEIDYTGGFQCTECGPYPQTLVMDATGLSFRRELGFWNSHIMGTGVPKDRIPKGSFSKRVLINDRRTRQLSATYTKKGLSDVDMEELWRLIDHNAPFLTTLIKHLDEEFPLKMHHCSRNWIKFIQCISSTSPVCALIPPTDEALKLVEELCKRDVTSDPEMLKCIQETMPALFELLSPPGSFPRQIMTPVLGVLKRIALAPFGEAIPVNTGTSVIEGEDTLCFFPSLPRIRSRRHYEADVGTKVRLCTKKYATHPSLTPGIFTLFCPHGICYGFEAMRLHESPNTPFSIIYERFPEGPSKLIYDNCCNLHNYCLNREPDFFMKTHFLVDKFHWRNHTACSWGYNIAMYPRLSAINSQVVEQANSALKRIKSSLSYMNPKNFMSHCKFFLWYINKERL